MPTATRWPACRSGRVDHDAQVPPGDRGIDVVATRGQQKQLIQAKRYRPNTTVGSPEVQQYAALRLQEEGDPLLESSVFDLVV